MQESESRWMQTQIYFSLFVKICTSAQTTHDLSILYGIHMNLKCVYLCWNPDSSIQLPTCHHLSLSFTHMLYECFTWNNPLPSSPTTLPSNHLTPASLACLLLFKCTSHALALGPFPSCFLSLTWKHLRYCLRYLLCTPGHPVLNCYFHLFTFFLFSSLSFFLSFPFPSLLFLFRKGTIPMLPPEAAKDLVLLQRFSHPGRYFTPCRQFFHPVKVLWSPACWLSTMTSIKIVSSCK